MTEMEALKILKEKQQAARLEPDKMKRLTKRVEDGSAVYYLYGFGAFDKLEALEECVDRLAAYEDTMPIERAQELAQAEKDGRLVVLPDAKYTDADGEKALQKAMFTCGNTNNPVTRYTADAITEKLCREAKEDNPPLTLEELREMDREPVWDIVLSKYGIVNVRSFNGKGCIQYVDNWTNPRCLVPGRYYRRKPEEGTK